MKKLLIFMLVLGMASLASATIVQVEVDVAGSISGNYGTGAGDLLVQDDQVKLKITLTDLDNYPYTTYDQYDGYVLSTLGITLETDADADMYVFGAPIVKKPKSALDTFVASVTTGDLDFAGSSSANDMEGYCAGAGNPIVWNIWLDITTADGETVVNMVLDSGAGTSWYKELLTTQLDDYTAMGESDLGDLTLYTVPEPATIALLGLGGLFLSRRRR